ncbi:MAG: hypothetical protein ACE144_02740 [Thermodesulfobacteriota bacterium]
MRRDIFCISRNLKWLISILCLLFLILHSPAYAQPEAASDRLIELINPLQGAQSIAKKPVIKCSIRIPFDPHKLFVLLDGIDISGILEITREGFEYKPVVALPSGNHTLNVTALTPDGKELKQDFTFSTRHSEKLEEVYSNNEITTLYEKLLGQSDEAMNQPSWKDESNLSSESKLKEKEWEFSFKTNVRHLDQNLPPIPPLEKGFSVADYLVQGKYTGKGFSFLGRTGDVVINETPNTVYGLARRGGDFVFQSSQSEKDLGFQLRTFAVKSEQVFGFNGGMGLETSTDDHIIGGSGTLFLLADKVRFGTIYVTGGEEGDSLGISTTGGKKKGNVLGYFFKTDFFRQKLVTLAELDISRFDPDTRDEFLSERDKAYTFKINGTWDKYNYEALYEYVGPDYEVIGSPGLQKNREGYTLNAGANYQIHIVNLSFSQYNDNVKKNELFPRTYTTQGTVDYTFSKFQSLPVGLSYQKTRLESRSEPAETLPVETDTDTVTGRINYIKGPWNLGFFSSYSIQNDQTTQDNDTTIVTHTLTPMYTTEFLSIAPALSFNRVKTSLTDVHTDTYTSSLDLRGNLFEKRVTYGFGGTYNWIKASDSTTKQDTINTTFNLSYLLVKNLWGFLNPSVGIRGLYNRINDRVLEQTTNELAIFLVIQTTMPFSF